MRLGFPFPRYEAIPPVEIPDANLIGVFQPGGVAAVREVEVLRRGFSSPIGALPLRAAVARHDRVLILIDDGTRGTPVALLLPHVLAELQAAGVADERIAFLQAPGTHRAMTPDELRTKLGLFFGQYPVTEHHYLDEASLHEFGHTCDGTRVTANRRLAEADFVLGIGGIVPHRVKGFSGGAKIAFPGVSGPEMMARHQWEASLQPAGTIMGMPENPIRLRTEEAARLSGLRYVANVVTGSGSRVVGCFVGDPVAAHRAGCRRARRLFAANLPTRADVVVIDSHPADRDLWQSAKGFYAGSLAVKRGGSLILVSPNPEGVARNHPNLLEIGYRPHSELVSMMRQGGVDDVIGLAILADLAQIIDQADCILVSPGVTRVQAERLGFRHATAPQEALDLALSRQGRSASIAVLRHGGHILPIVAGGTHDRRLPWVA